MTKKTRRNLLVKAIDDFDHLTSCFLSFAERYNQFVPEDREKLKWYRQTFKRINNRIKKYASKPRTK